MKGQVNKSDPTLSLLGGFCGSRGFCGGEQISIQGNATIPIL
jgi:hypothetical protein